jgi:hypothetical protein
MVSQTNYRKKNTEKENHKELRNDGIGKIHEFVRIACKRLRI